MTRFNLSAGKPAPYLRSGLSAHQIKCQPCSIGDHESCMVEYVQCTCRHNPKDDPPEPTPSNYHWQPNLEPNTPLQCGCSIPWPITCLTRPGGKQVWCEGHGWQHVAKKEIDRSERLNRKAKTCSDSSTQPSLPDKPPF